MFDLVFPKTLSPTQREMMRAAFFFPAKNPSKEAQKAATAFLLAANDGVKGWSTGGSKTSNARRVARFSYGCFSKKKIE